MLGTKDKIINYLHRQNTAHAHELVDFLGISSQAVHRHLKALVASGVLIKTGTPPRVLYSIKDGRVAPSKSGQEIMAKIAKIFRLHPQVGLVTLFGSYARGQERQNSDIDLLVWLAPGAKIGRREIWEFWDEQSVSLLWRDRVSIIVIRLAPVIRLHTLLLDFPEEHRPILDRKQYFDTINNAVCKWREHHGATKIPSFGNRHSWKYTNQSVRLSEINFDLELGDVA